MAGDTAWRLRAVLQAMPRNPAQRQD